MSDLLLESVVAGALETGGFAAAGLGFAVELEVECLGAEGGGAADLPSDDGKVADQGWLE
ncbi:hypothetical protein [Paludibaculum fermentans]|uniref:hypothetical protein n=1 Tax=Paludibaculum fermentans TaxID=1473598 RepID=UPI003EBBD623